MHCRAASRENRTAQAWWFPLEGGRADHRSKLSPVPEPSTASLFFSRTGERSGERAEHAKNYAERARNARSDCSMCSRALRAAV